jgi:hypothetical protein
MRKLGYSANGKRNTRKRRRKNREIQAECALAQQRPMPQIIFGLLGISAVEHIPCGPSPQHKTAPSIRSESQLNDHNCKHLNKAMNSS